uniref:group II intron maturase-specific domain-containing protein n=1 Tax=Massilia sp. TWR1-2-2 TaxID=2804584 RepID=UPI003CEA9ABD
MNDSREFRYTLDLARQYLTQDRSGAASEGSLNAMFDQSLGRLEEVDVQELAWQYNSIIRGWVDYYGAFHRTEMHKLFQYLDQRLKQ